MFKSSSKNSNALNGLTKKGGNIVLGGALTGNTVVGNTNFVAGFDVVVKVFGLSDNNDKILIAGLTNGYNTQYFLRLNNNGTVDTGFTNGNIDGAVFAVDIASDDKIYIGGDFNNYSGDTASGIIRLFDNGYPDNDFNTGIGFNDVVLALTIDNNGKILVGGQFTSYIGTTANRIVRLNDDGSIDGTFVYGGGFNNSVNTITVDSNDKIYVGGVFTDYDGTTANRIIRLNDDGSIDTGFVYNTGFDGVIYKIVIDNNGKILVIGAFTNYDVDGANYIIRLNDDGSPDNTFDYGDGFDSDPFGIDVDSNNKIILGGSFTEYDSTPANYIIRLNDDGSIDNTFVIGSGFDQDIAVVVVDSNDKVYVGGVQLAYKGIPVNRGIRLNNDGSYDNTYYTGDFERKVTISGSKSRLVIDSANGSELYEGGNQPLNISAKDSVVIGSTNSVELQMNLEPYTNGLSVSENLIIAFGTDPSFHGLQYDADYSANFDERSLVDKGYVLALVTSGGTLIGSTSSLGSETWLGVLAGYSGSSTYSVFVGASAGNLATGGSYSAFIGASAGDGATNAINSVFAGYAAGINATGASHSVFIGNVAGGSAINANESVIIGYGAGSSATNASNSVFIGSSAGNNAPDASNSIFIGLNAGQFDPVNNSTGSTSILIGKSTSTGGYTNSIALGTNATNSMSHQFAVDNSYLNWRIRNVDYVMPASQAVSGSESALKNDGTGVLSWSPITKLKQTDMFLGIQGAGSLNEQFLSTIGSGFNNTVFDLKVLSGDSVIIGGGFTTFNGNTANRIVKLNQYGNVNTGFTANVNNGFNAPVNSIGILSDNTIIAAGQFTIFDGMPQNYITKLNSNGTLNSTFSTNIGTGFNDTVNVIGIQTDNKILVGGSSFSSFNGNSANCLARLNSNGTFDSTFGANIGTGFTPSAGNVNYFGQQSDNSIIVVGVFTSFDGNSVNNILRLNSNGTFDSVFTANGGTGFVGIPYVLKVQDDDKILVGGGFTSFDGNTANHIVRLNADGSYDPTFNGSVFGFYVQGLAIQDDNKIIAASSNIVVRLNSTGGTDSSFIGGTVNNNTRVVGIKSNSEILIGGDFTQYNDRTANNIIELNVGKFHISGSTIFNGLEYDANYSTNFTPRSLVDKAYVDSVVGGGSGWSLSGTSMLTSNATINTTTFNLLLTGTTGTINIFKQNSGLRVAPNGAGVALVDNTGGGVYLESNASGTILINDIGGGLGLQSDTSINITNNGGDGIVINQAGGADGIDILNSAGGGITINDTNGGDLTLLADSGHIRIETTGGAITIEDNGGGGITLNDGGSGGINVNSDGGGITLEDNAGGGVYLTDVGQGGIYIHSDNTIDIRALDSGAPTPTFATFRSQNDLAVTSIRAALGNGSVSSEVELRPRTIVVRTGSLSGSGMTYFANYATGFTARSIPDVAFVTGLTVTANNGLTKSGNNIRLGGDLLSNTFIDGAFNLDIGGSTELNRFRVRTLAFGNLGKIDLDSTGAKIGTDDESGDFGASLSTDSSVARILAYDLTDTAQITVSTETNGGIVIQSTDAAFEGAKYSADFTANFVARSLVDKDYVDTAVSDIRLKENVVKLGSALSLINGLNPVEFDFIKTKEHKAGFIAQEVETVIPSLVVKPETEDSFYKIKESQLIPYLVKAIQELTEQVKELQAQLSQK